MFEQRLFDFQTLLYRYIDLFRLLIIWIKWYVIIYTQLLSILVILAKYVLEYAQIIAINSKGSAIAHYKLTTAQLNSGALKGI